MMKTILVTGATGFLGSKLVKAILDRGDKVIAVLGRSQNYLELFSRNDNVKMCSHLDLFSSDFGNIDTLIHSAFSRGENLHGLTESLSFSKRIIDYVNQNDTIQSVINISTQGIYHGLKPKEKVAETGCISPNTSYGLAKFAVEKMFEIGSTKPYTNIRLASLSANARFLDFFVDSVIAHKDINITAPRQYASIMDVSDAVNGILSVESIPVAEREDVYNLGPDEQYSILDYANAANQIGQQYGYNPVQITVNDNGNEFAICMDSSKLRKQTGWKPVVSKTLMLQKMFDK